MYIKYLKLQHFRAHDDTSVSFLPGVNVLHGPNGAGKTNVLEAIHYLALSKSFLTNNDRYALRTECAHFEVRGTFVRADNHDARIQDADQNARLVYAPPQGKRAFVNDAPLDKLTDLIGRFPVVVYSPADHALTAEGPEQRRRFVDNVLCQSFPVYLDDLVAYRRVVKQRNALLVRAKYGGASIDSLSAWNEELVERGSRIAAARLKFVKSFQSFLQQAFVEIAHVAEEPTIDYVSGICPPEAASADEIRDRYRRKLETLLPRERELGRTLAGPHRDELLFKLNDFEVRRYASQGQHRTFGMALKIAQHHYLADVRETTPVLLLDDAFAHLDQSRTAAFLQLLYSDAIGQSIIAAASAEAFERSGVAPDIRYIEVAGGKVVESMLADQA